MRGVLSEGETQIVLVDTPGIFKPRRRLDRAMVASAWGGAEDADAVVHLVDVQAELAVIENRAKAADHRQIEDARAITEGLKASNTKAVLALNKIDGVKRESLLQVVHIYADTKAYEEIFMISAERGSGVDDLKASIARRMPEGPWLYPEDQAADLPMRLLAAEITREKIYLRVHDELPYAAAVETTAFEERPDGSVRIEQTVYVERDTQRAIVLGHGGQTLKWIGQSSREELGELMDRKVHLFLTVKTDERWAERRDLYGQVGLDYDV